MKIAAVYDIHANLPALEAVVEEIRREQVDRVVVGGDVLPGPMPRETIACLLTCGMPTEFIRGNGDREVLAWAKGAESDVIPEAYRESMRWVARQITADDANLMAGWPPTLRMKIPGIGDVLFCHATPQNDTDTFTALTPEETLVPIFQGVNARIVVCGHTHVQFDRSVGSTRVVNAGSVGMPFEAPGAYWLLLDRGVQLRQTRYDFAGAGERIRQTAYPDAYDFAGRYCEGMTLR